MKPATPIILMKGVDQSEPHALTSHTNAYHQNLLDSTSPTASLGAPTGPADTRRTPLHTLRSRCRRLPRIHEINAMTLSDLPSTSPTYVRNVILGLSICSGLDKERLRVAHIRWRPASTWNHTYVPFLVQFRCYGAHIYVQVASRKGR